MIEDYLFTMDKKIIIFEGLDRCGKSTQLDLLEKKLESYNLKPLKLHYGRPLYSTLEYQYTYYTQEFYQYHLMTKDDPKTILLLDRSFLGEFVWSHFRDYDGEEIIEKLYNTQIFQEIKDSIIYFLFFDSWSNFKQRNDGKSLFKNEEEFNLANKKFKKSFDYLKQLGYDYNKYNVDLLNFPQEKEKSISSIHKFITDKI